MYNIWYICTYIPGTKHQKPPKKLQKRYPRHIIKTQSTHVSPTPPQKNMYSVQFSNETKTERPPQKKLNSSSENIPKKHHHPTQKQSKKTARCTRTLATHLSPLRSLCGLPARRKGTNNTNRLKNARKTTPIRTERPPRPPKIVHKQQDFI